jgi:hypothetical protein
VTKLKWKLISVHLLIVLISTKDRWMHCLTIPLAQKSFWMQPMELLGDVGHVESSFGLFGASVSVSARYVHGLHQTYSKKVLDAPDA